MPGPVRIGAVCQLMGSSCSGKSWLKTPHRIVYCRGCRWLLRATWMAQELLTTFEEELGGVTLSPGTDGGIFEVRCNTALIWSRKVEGRFPDIKELKQLVRDQVAPGRNLGHTEAGAPVR